MALVKSYKNALGEYVYLTNEVFEILWGTDFSNPRVAKDIVRMDFSGKDFALETLVGPEQGLLNDKVKNARGNVQVLNVGRNQLTDISLIDKKKSSGDPEFYRLTCLIASRNQLTKVSLTLPNLLELNLAHNELTLMPSTKGLPNLQTLILAHNKINDTLSSLEGNKKLKKLLLHDNLFSWKPTEFKKQMTILAGCHLYRLTIFPNPFAKVFKEYQFLAVTVIDTLHELDGYAIDTDLRRELRDLEEQKKAANALDYSIFDIKVQERQAEKGVGGEGPKEYVDFGKIPSLDQMIARLNKPLDHPNQLIKYCYAFKDEIRCLWGARYSDRKEKLSVKDEREGKEKVNEVISKMQLLLGRFDSAQDVLVECLVRLCASGNTHLSQSAAVALADWVDSLPPSVAPEDAGGLLSIAAPLFRELRVRLLPGMQGFNDHPAHCMEMSKRRPNSETQEKLDRGFYGTNDEIAESAEILGALAKFGKACFAAQGSPGRSAILCPLLPVLCRASREDMGPEKLPDEKATFVNFGFFEGAMISEPITVSPEGFESVCYGRCVKHNYGGFQVKASIKSHGLLDAWFSKDSPEALRGMRVPAEGVSLFTMPCRTVITKGVEEVSGVPETLTWDVWRNGLDVLVVATSDPKNAHLCVKKFGLHQMLLKHEQEVFTESLLNVAAEAGVAFTSLLNLAVNLMGCDYGQTSALVKKSFHQAKLHVACWNRVRRRLTEGGSTVSRQRLKQATPELTFLVSALVRVIFEMSENTKEVKRGRCKVMADLADGMEDLFEMMLEIAADTDVPDPLLLSASLQMLHLFLACEFTRVKEIKGQSIVQIVLERLHEIQTLLPYIRGPRLNDNNNNKYQDLWQLCEIKYTKDSFGMQRLPQLYDPMQRQNGEWREKCPELKDLRNPLMHRVLLDIVKLLQLFSSQVEHDPSNEFRRVTEMLDRNDREKILIGPSTGLVLVPDYDVKLGVLKVIQHVLESAPSQFQTQEMGWLLRYLQSSGLGVGRQEYFLGQVLVLTKILIQNLQDTGFQFRQQFAKQAIRQAFEMLKANTARDLNGAVDEEESKIALSLEIVNMLRVCSKPLSGGLRPFLRRVDFMEIVKSVMVVEDGPRQTGIREPLLRTWTGRDMREVLLPLVTMNLLATLGVGRYRALARLADVLQSRSDFATHAGQDRGGYIGRRTTDEALMWDGLWAMKELLSVDDDLFMADAELQQNEFISQNAIDGCLEYVEKIYGSHEMYQAVFQEIVAWVKLKFVLFAQEKVLQLWDEVAMGERGDTAEVETRAAPKQSNLAKFLEVRLQSVNEHLGSMYTGISVAVFVERLGGSSLTKLADHVKGYVEECIIAYRPHRADPNWKKLQEIPNCYVDMDSKLKTQEELEAKKIKYVKCRQVLTTMEQLEQYGKVAQKQLKRLLLSRTEPDPEKAKWSDWAYDTGTQEHDEARRDALPGGFIDELTKHDASVYDPGCRPMDEIERAMTYKYMGDISRVRNRSRLILCFTSSENLLNCANALKENSRFSVLAVRNRFKATTSLGERYVKLYVEVMVLNSKFICELTLVLGSHVDNGKTFNQEQKLKGDLRFSLKEICNVSPEKLDDVCDCICYEMASRAIRHQDVIYIESEAHQTQTLGAKDWKSIMVQQEKVTLSGEKKTQRNLYIIERVAGFGPIKTGDVVRFQNYLTHNYLDSSPVNFGIRCRYGDPDTPASNLEFVVEAAPKEKAQLDEEEEAVAKTTAKKRKVVADLPKILTHGAKFLLRINGSSSPVRCLTVMPPRWGEGGQILKAEAKWSPKNPVNQPAQIFSIYREGSLRWFLDSTDMDAAEKASEGKLYSIVQTGDQEQAFHLQFAYMAPALSIQAPQEGGLYRRSPPNFRDIAVKKGVNGDDDEAGKQDDDAGPQREKQAALVGKELQVNTENLATLAVACLCRCVYSLVEIPALEDARIFAIDTMLGIPEGDILPSMNSKLARFLAVAISATIVPELGKITPDGTIVGVTKESVLLGWVAAKFLRTMSAVLVRMPPLSLQASKRTPKLSEPDGGEAKHQDLARRGAYDRQRLCVLQTHATYISRVLSSPLLRRLAIAAQRPMKMPEVTLLVEFCRGVNAIVRAYYSNELRCVDPKNATADEDVAAITNPHAKHAAIDQGAVAGARAIGNGSSASGQLAIAGEEAGGMLSLFADDEEKPITCIRGKLESKMFASLIPPNVLRVLVHSFLHGMRMETQAYAQQRNIANEADDSVKLISSLVQESIQALASCMHGCGDQSMDSSCDYDVLEAISHAMCAGAQFVPRARVTQLMSEWHLEQHRKCVQEKIDNAEDEFEQNMFGETIYPQLLPTERVHIVSYVWTAMFTDAELLSPASEVQRRLLVVTSRQIFMLLTLPEDTGVELPAYDDMEVHCCRCLSRVQTVVLHPRMRNFVGMIWDHGPHENYQALFFENHYRRKEFVQVLRTVTRFRPIPGYTPDSPDGQKLEIGPTKGIIFAIARRDMLLHLRKSCKARGEARAEAQLVNISFVQIEKTPNVLQVLIMTRDAIAAITIGSFLQYWAKSEKDGRGKDGRPYPHELEDSDEEVDAIPQKMDGDLNEMDDLKIWEQSHEPMQFKKLTGVWFMAEPEPKVTLQFGDAMKLQFYSEGDRQRFRQHLAGALKNDNEGGEDDADAQLEQGRLWRVKPTAQTELNTVKKEVREVEVYVEQHMKRLLDMSAQRA